MLHKCLTVALFLFSFTSVHAQEITLGSSVFLNSTSFDFEGNSNANSQLATAQNTIEIGLTYDLSDVIWVQHRAAFNKQVHEVAQLFEYSYIYSFAAIQNNLCFNANDHFYFGVGVPVNVSLEATQFNNFGSIDLLVEKNAPPALIGYTALIGYKTNLTEKIRIHFDLSRNHFLNSLDNDPGQQLTVKSYVISLKAAFSL